MLTIWPFKCEQNEDDSKECERIDWERPMIKSPTQRTTGIKLEEGYVILFTEEHPNRLSNAK